MLASHSECLGLGNAAGPGILKLHLELESPTITVTMGIELPLRTEKQPRRGLVLAKFS